MKRGVYKLWMIFGVLIGLFITFGSPVWTGESQGEREHHYRPDSFESDSRAEWQMVDRVIQAMGLREGDHIADIGGGTGYFSRPFARRVGPRGVVYCCDLATYLLEYLQIKAAAEGLSNIVTVYAAMDRPMLPYASVDVIFFCDTNHHLENRVEYYKGLIPLLRPGGRLVVVDWKKERMEVGPPPSHTVAKSVVMEEMKEAGWKLVKEETFLPYQYFLIFEPVKPKANSSE